MFIAYNECYGGFSLSGLAIERYAELKDIKLCPKKQKWGDYIFYTVPPEGRDPNSEQFLDDREITRHDHILTQVIKELGDKVNGEYAKLKLTEVDKGTLYRITQYDGLETIHYIDESYDWNIVI